MNLLYSSEAFCSAYSLPALIKSSECYFRTMLLQHLIQEISECILNYNLVWIHGLIQFRNEVGHQFWMLEFVTAKLLLYNLDNFVLDLWFRLGMLKISSRFISCIIWLSEKLFETFSFSGFNLIVFFFNKHLSIKAA